MKPKYLASPRAFILSLSMFLLTSCSTTAIQEQIQYDFGLTRTLSPNPVRLSPISVADVGAPAWLDGTRMTYRLAYANEMRLRTYALSRWTTPPAKIFEQRLKSLLTQRHKAVLTTTEGASGLPVLKIDLEEFSQVFSSPQRSTAHVTIRAAFLQGRSVVAQQSFTREVPAATPDAPGGAAALARASEAIISDVADWLSAFLSE